MTSRFALAGLAALLALVGCAGPVAPGGSPDTPPPTVGALTLPNPVLGQGADPFLVVVDGRYYYPQSAADGSGVTIRSSTSLATLQFAPEQEVVQAGAGGAPCCEYWAPEVHRIGSRWYLYVAADDGHNEHHRMYVFSAGTVAGPYRFAGQLALPGNRWAIDATVLTVGAQSYVAWSGWPGPRNGEQDIYLARLSSPTTAGGPGVRLSRPRYPWETQAGTVGVKVNEAPAALVRGGRVFLSYSASGCWTPDYALGMLTARTSSDLLDASSWRKSATPVFSGGAATGLYGTGHNGFFTSPDGSQTWLTYHAVTDAAGSCGADRQVYAQPITFAADGTPELGTPTSGAVPLPAGDPGH